MARRAVIPISMQLLHEVLNLPDDVEVLHAQIGNVGLTLELVITAPDMRDLDPAAMPPHVTPAYTRTSDGGVRLHSIDYPRVQRVEEGV